MQRALFHLVSSAVLGTAILLPWHILAAQLATITTDTGAFAPGHRDFSRYDTPGLCRAAARNTRASFQVSLEAQTIEDTLSEDTVGVGGTAPVARACGARFTPVNTVVRDRRDLFDLALHEQNDTLAQAVLATLVAQAATPDARDTTWIVGLSSYLQFGRLAAAEALLAQVEAHGAVPPSTLLSLHALLGGYFDRSGDPVRFRQEIAQELTLAHDHMFQGYSYAETAFEDLMRLAAIDHPDSMPAIAQRAQFFLRQATKQDKDQEHILVKNMNWGKLPLDSVIDLLAPAWYTYRRDHGGMVAPRLQADYWFPAPGRPSSDTVRPVQGKVNLICVGGALVDGEDLVFNGMPLYSGYQQAAHIRRWLTQYGAAGLDVTIVRSASGYINSNYLQIDLFRLSQTPAEEARVWRWYVQEYEQLPVSVVVQVRHDQWLPQPDGRRWSEPKTQVADYMMNASEKPGSCTIIDRDGVILFSSPGGSHDEAEANRKVGVMLQWLFQGPGASETSMAPSGAVPRASLPSSSISSSQSLRDIAP